MFALGLIAPALTALAWWRLRTIDATIEQRDAEIAVLNHVPMFRPLPMPAIDGLALHDRRWRGRGDRRRPPHSHVGLRRRLRRDRAARGDVAHATMSKWAGSSRSTA
jgi:hypothetical protein